MYSGYMPLHFEDNNEGSFFFWLATQRKHNIVSGAEKLLIWLVCY
jgi:hypothetical protein